MKPEDPLPRRRRRNAPVPIFRVARKTKPVMTGIKPNLKEEDIMKSEEDEE